MPGGFSQPATAAQSPAVLRASGWCFPPTILDICPLNGVYFIKRGAFIFIIFLIVIG